MVSDLALLCHQVTKSNTNPDELGGLAGQLTTDFGDLASEAKCAAITAENAEVTLQHCLALIGLYCFQWIL